MLASRAKTSSNVNFFVISFNKSARDVHVWFTETSQIFYLRCILTDWDCFLESMNNRLNINDHTITTVETSDKRLK